MIKIEELSIREFRGIRDATLAFRRNSVVVSGPNGTGKSGVVDAIQFALCGEVARLTGQGSKDLSLAAHGPHVVVRDSPEASWVSLKAYIPHLKVSATITRTVKSPTKPKIIPNTPEVLAVFGFLEAHAELTLSRREIIKYVLSEDGKRSTEVQTLLRLESLGTCRTALKTAANKLKIAAAQAEAVVSADLARLREHFGSAEWDDGRILERVSIARRTLGLPPITDVLDNDDVTSGLPELDRSEAAGPGRTEALADLVGITTHLRGDASTGVGRAVKNLRAGLKRAEDDPRLLIAIKRLALLEAGQALIDAEECPLCELPWNADALRERLRLRIAESKAGRQLRDQLVADGGALAIESTQLSKRLEALAHVPEATPDEQQILRTWSFNLAKFARSISEFDGILRHTDRILLDWTGTPAGGLTAIGRLQEAINQRPEDSEAGAARDFLVVAQERRRAYNLSKDKQSKHAAAYARGNEAYEAYVAASEQELTALYATVEGDFSSYYQALNADDEHSFKAKLTPDEARLSLAVDFHQKGMFPPGAYHSEGHQDGMGVCLYLALVKQALGNGLTLVVLDDVVMSVDAGHRRKFCELLRERFPDIQFVITTHDEVWAKQLRSAGVVDSEGTVSFHSWDVENGPLLEIADDVWARIDADLRCNDVPAAAAKLRRYLEFAATELADSLGATVRFRADGNYDLGDLLEPVIAQQNRLLKQAVAAAESWGDAPTADLVRTFQQVRRAILEQRSEEQWLMNKAVHYKEWAMVVKEDFLPIRDAFKALLDQWRCTVCSGSLAPSPRTSPANLRCRCGKVTWNLRQK